MFESLGWEVVSFNVEISYLLVNISNSLYETWLIDKLRWRYYVLICK